MRDLRSPVQRQLDDMCEKGLDTLALHAESKGRGWMQVHVGRFGTIILMIVDVNLEKENEDGTEAHEEEAEEGSTT